MEQYVVSWYEKNRLLTTNKCKTFNSREKAIDYYFKLSHTKENSLDKPITKISFSKIEVLE